MDTASTQLSDVIDEYLLWFIAWHRMALATGEERKSLLAEVEPPASFAAWREGIFQELANDQPAIEKLSALHEQMHTLIRLLVMKAAPDQPMDRADDENVTAKYRELMRGLRRFEQAFAAAASGLDALTGLRGRGGLMPEIERELKRYERTSTPFCVAIMDIDHFKKVNDTYGHDIGDRVLAAASDHVSRSLRAHDDAFRFGGEEFVLCLKDVDIKAGYIVLERLRASLSLQAIAIGDGTSIYVTASFGLAMATPTMNASELLKHADEALYRAKHEGRNRVILADVPALLEAKA